MEQQILKTKRITEKLELPEDVIFGVPNIYLTGNTKLVIENHKGILEYESNHIVLSTKFYRIHIQGNGLHIQTYHQDEILVEGYILQISFVE